MASDVAIDIGTSFTRLATAERGVLFNEPTIVAIDTNSGEVVEVGYGAKDAVSRTSRHVVAFRPLAQGATIDFDVTARLISGLFQRTGLSKFSRARVVMSVPTLATPIERRALRQAAIQAGAREVSMVEAPIAAAIGLGLPVQDPVGSAVVVLGGGASEASIISLGGIVSSSSRRLGGVDLDLAIATALRQHYSVVASPETIEALKCNLGSALGYSEGMNQRILARTVEQGKLTELEVDASVINNAIVEVLSATVRMIQDCLGDAPPDLSQDVSSNGLILVGGHALLSDFAELIADATGVEVEISTHADLRVIEGLQLCLEEMSSLHSLFRSAER